MDSLDPLGRRDSHAFAALDLQIIIYIIYVLYMFYHLGYKPHAPHSAVHAPVSRHSLHWPGLLAQLGDSSVPLPPTPVGEAVGGAMIGDGVVRSGEEDTVLLAVTEGAVTSCPPLI
jgi:hypothetical protein